MDFVIFQLYHCDNYCVQRSQENLSVAPDFPIKSIRVYGKGLGRYETLIEKINNIALILLNIY